MLGLSFVVQISLVALLILSFFEDRQQYSLMTEVPIEAPSWQSDGAEIALMLLALLLSMGLIIYAYTHVWRQPHSTRVLIAAFLASAIVTFPVSIFLGILFLGFAAKWCISLMKSGNRAKT